MKILITEFHFGGHYFEYIKHFLEALIVKRDDYNKYIFYLHPKFHSTIIGNLTRDFDFIEINYFSLVQIEDYNNAKSHKKSAIISSFVIQLYSQILFNHVIYFNINLLFRDKMALNIFRRLPFTFSGIFFHSPFYLKEMGFRKFFTRFKREFMLRVLSLNVNCTRVFLLNDKKGSEFYSKWSSKIKFIPDPVNLVKPAEINIRSFHNLEDDIFVFLHIGTLGLYKGSDLIVNSIYKLDFSFFKSSVFLFVGRIDKDLDSKIKSINNYFEREVIIVRNEYVDEDVFSSYMYQSDCVVIANRNVESSSGILNHSLVRSKRIISPDKGYFKDKLANYKNCYFFKDEVSLRNSYLDVLNDQFYFSNSVSSDNFEFFSEYSPSKFSEILLSQISR